MRKIIVSMRITLDGFVTGPNGEMDWMEEFMDDALGTYETELQKSVDTSLFGRETYQGFASYWPQVARDPASPQGMVEYAQKLNAMRKIVFSKTLSHAEWNNSTIVSEIILEEIIKLKQEKGRDIVIHGSASIVRTLTNLGLIDRYQLLVYPVVLGSGKPLFQDISHQVKLSLVDTQTHPSGVVVLSYEPVKN
ncbi:dihydrofolate reductase family protein [Dictyobacter formicarum]|uniref:Pyrimidine reductase n=1 Tax=Dictyobacter formicarum TaxID=2778368 RepID=A0ABQ3VU39_9CHLR|nr:dihydrofolate reductase family protein [Dictyobacter formicarum]GHO89209.1 pyrimidine reductase [Dictyobacter formicarum]